MLIESPIEAKMRELLGNGRVDVIADIYQEYEIGPYRVDFLLMPKRGTDKGLIIECDGEEFHSSVQALEYDSIRQKYLEDLGYRVMRLTGKEIHSLRSVDEIKRAVMVNTEPYETGRIFIEMVDKSGDVYLVPR